MKKKDEGRPRKWGFTEVFCGLDRLVLARDVRGRSPMLEDVEMEVFSINVSWPRGQRDRWVAFVEQEERREDGKAASMFEKDGNVRRRSRHSLGLKA